MLAVSLVVLLIVILVVLLDDAFDQPGSCRRSFNAYPPGALPGAVPAALFACGAFLCSNIYII